MGHNINRRTFLKQGAVAGAGLTFLKSGMAAGQSPHNKLNIAVIGIGDRGKQNLKAVSSENIVALCDVDKNNLADAAKQFPLAKTYIDWRECLEQKDIDAVVCSTTDHTHAFINIWVMNRGLHVYCEKPLANSVHEARMVRKCYQKNKHRVATQMGTQIHASENFRRVVELIRHGAIGKVKKVSLWCNRTPKGGSYLPEAGPVPDHIDWDLWIGPSPMHPYNPGYFGNCLKWNYFWDFSSGQIGDMGSHVIDMAYWALGLRFPTSCQAKGSPLSSDTCPQWLVADWEHPANDWRPAVTVHWFDGGKKPGMPSKIFNRDEMGLGGLFSGDKGWLLAGYDYRTIMFKDDMTYYQTPEKSELIPPSPGHHQEWIDACKTGKNTLCNFDYSGALIEHNLLALVSYRLGQKIAWDAKNLKATNCPAADQYIYKTYRQGWCLDG